MTIETRLRNTGQIPSGGGSSDSGGLAGTGGFYVSWSSDPLLSNERILTAGSSVTVRTDSTAIYLDALTGGFVPTARTITTTFPLGGGGDLSADRTFTVNTAYFANSARLFVSWSSDTLLSNEKILTAGSNITVTTDSTTITVAGLPNQELFSWRQVGSTPGISFDRLYIAGNPMITQSLTTVPLAINSANCMPFIVTRSMKIDRMVCFISATGIDAVYRIGIYTNSGPYTLYPSQAVFTSGILSGSNAGLATADTVQVLSDNSLYWFVTHVGTAATEFRSSRESSVFPLFGEDSSLTTTAAGYGVVIGLVFSNGLPASFGNEGTIISAPTNIALAVRLTQ